MYYFYVCIVHTYIHTEYQDHDAIAIRDATTNKADRSKKMNTTIDRRAEKASDRAHILLSDTANTNKYNENQFPITLSPYSLIFIVHLFSL